MATVRRLIAHQSLNAPGGIISIDPRLSTPGGQSTSGKYRAMVNST